MHILYIHGLDSQPNLERLAHLHSLGHRTEALHIDYRNEPNTYQILSQLIIDEKIEYIVGSSFGGFLGFWLGEEFGIPSLLFNPAMHWDAPAYFFQEPQKKISPGRRVVIGAQDDVVDPQKNWDFFQEESNLAQDQRVILCQWLGHQIDFDTFVDACSWARL